MRGRNKSVTEMVRDQGIQDAKAWRDHWQARAAEEPMRDEGDLYARPVVNRRMLLGVLAFLILVYLLLTAALVLLP